MPLLLPLSLLGSLEIDTLKREFSGALDWFGILTFGLTAALVWGIWFWSYAGGMPFAVAQLFRDTESGYRPALNASRSVFRRSSPCCGSYWSGRRAGRIDARC